MAHIVMALHSYGFEGFRGSGTAQWGVRPTSPVALRIARDARRLQPDTLTQENLPYLAIDGGFDLDSPRLWLVHIELRL